MSEPKPGRELDSLIAEKVFGRSVVTYRNGDIWRVMLNTILNDGWKYIDIGTGILKNIPPYSTNIAAAWEVVEKLRSERMMVSIVSDEDGGWNVEMWDYNNRQSKEVFSETAPHAICLAALKAVGYEDKTCGAV